MNKFYITNAIPYVNAKPHIGHALEFIQSDDLQSIISDYFELLGLEEAPEKGERRTSDDFIFVAEEIFRESIFWC